MSIPNRQNHCSNHDFQRDQQRRDAMNVGLLRQPRIQAFLTWLTAIPHSGQVLRERHRLENFITALIILPLGLSASHQAVVAKMVTPQALLLLVVGYGLTVAALRCLQLPNYHNCSHSDLTGHRRVDHCIGLLLGTLLWAAPISAYKRSHATGPGKTHHKWNHLLTPGENNFEAIRRYGFRPGASRAANWRHFWLLLINPFFYLGRLGISFRKAFFTGPKQERLFSLAVWSAVLSLVIHQHAVVAFTLIWLVPRGVFYEIAELLRILVEHTFPPTSPGGRTMADYRMMTKAIFSAEPVPALSSTDPWLKRALAWLRWGLAMAFLHLPARIWVLTGDTPCHDLHHARPGADWANYEVGRQRLGQSGYSLTANWGLFSAIDNFFASLERQPVDLFGRGKV